MAAILALPLASLANFVGTASSAVLQKRSTAVTVNTGTTYQTMDGFGFSEAFGPASQVEAWTSSQQTETFEYLFSTSSGAGLNILRNCINVFETTNPGSPSATPDYNSLDGDDGQIWFSQQAKSYGVSTFYADAWTAPAFMKTNDNINDGGYLCGVTNETCSSGDWRQAYANYLVKYVQDYSSEGITIDYLGFVNEPDNSYRHF
jgi:O-glycosyl hydrolase